MLKKNGKKDTRRMYGIDYFRCVAILAVIILHTSSPQDADPELWLRIRQVSKFAVPYFLSVSFFLAFNQLFYSERDFPILKRLKRLLIPYAFWSIFYIIFNLLIYSYKGKLEEFLQDYIYDFPKVIFLGGASFHLWFLPLLMVGTLLLKFTASYFRHAQLIHIGLLFFASSFLYSLMVSSGNHFAIGSNIAFLPLLKSISPDENYHPILRVGLVYLSWLIQCLPYLCFSALAVHGFHSSRLQQSGLSIHWGFWILFVLAFLFANFLFIAPVADLVRGCFALVGALVISSKTSNASSMLFNLSDSVYGIYFNHWMVTVLLYFFINQIFQDNFGYVSTFGLMLISCLTLSISWLLNSIMFNIKFYKTFALGII